MEKLLYYMWEHRLLSRVPAQTTEGEAIEVIDPGRRNPDSGPDFFNAKIRIGNRIWAGNVEMHLRSSDWVSHRHMDNPVYDSVILHVVTEADVPIHRTNGEEIPQWVVPIPVQLQKDYIFLTTQSRSLPCQERLYELSSLFLTDWFASLAIERLQQKSDRILRQLDRYEGNWEEVCYVTLSRSMGFGINGDAFERLARSLPLRFLQKHADSLVQVEAFLFGQAGLLADRRSTDDSYYQGLCREYDFLRNKFSLTPIPPECWKFSRLRPANFPHQRIALLAQLIHRGFQLFANLLNCTNEKEVQAIFEIHLEGYWNTHYTFGTTSVPRSKTLGRGAIRLFIINCVAPLFYAYAVRSGNERIADCAMRFLEELPAEDNHIVRTVTAAGIKVRSALDSQAAIQLYTSYCDPHKCIYCRIGHRLLSSHFPKEPTP
ncbi:MAG: DUF2851 family protein [Porphyromonadaceae bacterium]|nr:DUF2851 family protein [Porphyromonadaceae bacterium]